jgi:Holliday junction resolvase
MSKAQRDKGLRVEREIVKACLSSGIKTERVRAGSVQGYANNQLCFSRLFINCRPSIY